MNMRISVCISAAALLASAGARAEERTQLPKGAFVVPVAGPVRVLGSLRDRTDGSVLDAAHDRRGGEGGPGLVDWQAGGLRLVGADEAHHTYAFEPTGEPGRACAAVGIEGACLVGRLLPSAVARLVTQEELAERLDGTLELEGAVAVAPPPASSVRQSVPLRSPATSRGLVLGGLALAFAVAAFALVRRRRMSPVARARRALRRLEAIARTRPVYAPLLDLGHDLARQLCVIAAQRSALRTSAAWRDQLAQCDTRSERIAARLEVLVVEVSRSACGEPQETALIGALNEELALAQESVRAADRLLVG